MSSCTVGRVVVLRLPAVDQADEARLESEFLGGRMAQPGQGIAHAGHDVQRGLRNHPRILRDAVSVLVLRAGRFDGVGESQDRRQVLSELVVQFAGQGAPLVVADFKQTPGQDGAAAPWPAPGGRRDRSRPVRSSTSSIDRKRGKDVRYWPCAMRCSAATIDRAGARVCAMASEASRAMAIAISSATSMMSKMCSQASHIAASGSANGRHRARGRRADADRPGHRRVVAEHRLHGRREPRGGDLPSPLLWPQSGFSKAMAGSKRMQTPGEMSFIVSMVRHSGTGKRCSRILLLCNSSSRQYRPSNACETRSADAAVARRRCDGRRPWSRWSPRPDIARRSPANG